MANVGLTEYLMEFGLTRQEATIYLNLMERGMQTGYEVSKQTGISRSNVYRALAGLVEKGAAYTSEENATKYMGIDVEEFCSNKIRRMEQYKEILAVNMPKEHEEAEGYLTVSGDEQIQHKMLTNAIEKAQMKIEGNNFGIRKNLLEYDQVMNDQREIIYEERRRVLNGESMRDVIYKMITDRVENTIDTCISSDIPKEDWDLTELNELLLPIIPLKPITAALTDEVKDVKELKHKLKEQAVKLYEAKEAEFPEPEALRELERVILLKVIDRKWMDHIDDMDQLRQGIGLQAYGQKDPLVEYKMSGFDMFDDMIANIQEDTVRLLFHVRIEQKVEREQVAKVTGTNKDDSVAATPKRRETAKVYPNDPCPCGSGKKYKQCCGRR